MKSTSLVTLTLALMSVIASPASAQTAEAGDTVVVANGDVHPLASVRINANAGDEFYVSARMQTKSARQSPSHRMLVALRLSCLDGVDEIRTTQNMYYGQQVLVHRGRYIFQAPSNGAFECKLQARGLVHGQQSDPPARFTVDGANTYIAVSGKQPSWVRNKYQSSQRLIRTGAAKDVSVMWFRAPNDVARFSAISDVEMTNCYDDGYLCDTVPRNTLKTVIGTRLLVMQKDRSGGYCKITGYPNSGLKSTTITWEQHHKKAYHRLVDIPVSTHSSCTRDFRIKVYTRAVSGNDVLIETKPYTNTLVKQ